MTTNEELADLIRGMERRIGGRLIRLGVYTKGIMGKLLAPEEVTQLEYEAAQAEQLNQPSTAGR